MGISYLRIGHFSPTFVKALVDSNLDVMPQFFFCIKKKPETFQLFQNANLLVLAVCCDRLFFRNMFFKLNANV